MNPPTKQADPELKRRQRQLLRDVDEILGKSGFQKKRAKRGSAWKRTFAESEQTIEFQRSRVKMFYYLNVHVQFQPAEAFITDRVNIPTEVNRAIHLENDMDASARRQMLERYLEGYLIPLLQTMTSAQTVLENWHRNPFGGCGKFFHDLDGREFGSACVDGEFLYWGQKPSQYRFYQLSMTPFDQDEYDRNPQFAATLDCRELGLMVDRMLFALSDHISWSCSRSSAVRWNQLHWWITGYCETILKYSGFAELEALLLTGNLCEFATKHELIKMLTPIAGNALLANGNINDLPEGKRKRDALSKLTKKSDEVASAGEELP
jgi:hypothetical protein